MQRVFSVAIVIYAVFNLAVADFRQDALDEHNKYRAKHHSQPLALSKELNKYAQKYAEKMAKSDRFKHSGGKYGENIYTSTKMSLSDSEVAIEATDMWYDEVSMYDFAIPTFSKDTGHFTQVVWNNTKYLGIGVARSKKNVYVCANYDPRGNYAGKFIQNVLRLLV